MPISKKRLDEIKAIKDEDIDTSDIPELDEQFWENAKLVMPKPKETISLEVDTDVLNWFQSYGKDYKEQINSALRTYIEEHQQEQR